VAYVAILDQIEGDDRLERLEAWLAQEPNPGRFVPRELAELNRALGVG
jgi:hypothetical protein